MRYGAPPDPATGAPVGPESAAAEAPAVLSRVQLLRTQGLALVARVPVGTVGLLVVLHLRDLGHSYAVAGAGSGGAALGMATSAWVLGRLMDRRGLRPVLLVCAVLAAMVWPTFAALPASTPVPLLLLGAFVVGAALPPVAACARTVWQRALEAHRFARTITLDVTLQELVFMFGPLLLVWLAVVTGPATAIAVVGVGLAAVTALFALLPEVRSAGRSRSDSGDGPGVSALWSPAVRTLLVAVATMGFAFGVVEIGVLASAEHAGVRGATGVLLAVFGGGSVVGGLVAARRGAAADPPLAMIRLMLVIAGCLAVLAVLPTLGWLAVGLFAAGATVAPLFGVAYYLVGRLAPDGAMTEAFTLQTAALTAGIALGAAVSGSVNAAIGTPAVFAVGAVIAVLGAATQWGLRGALVVPADPAG